MAWNYATWHLTPTNVDFFFKDRVGKPIFMHLLLKIKVFPENMGIGLDKKYKKNIFFDFGGSIWTPQPGVRSKIIFKLNLKISNCGADPRWGGPYGLPKIKKRRNSFFLSSPIPIFSGKTFIFSNRCIKIGFPTLSLKKKLHIRWGQMSGCIISCHIYIQYTRYSQKIP